MKHTKCNERIEDGNASIGSREGKSERQVARPTLGCLEGGDVDERSINDFGLVLMSRKEEKEEDSLEQRRHMARLVGRTAGHTGDHPHRMSEWAGKGDTYTAGKEGCRLH